MAWVGYDYLSAPCLVVVDGITSALAACGGLIKHVWTPKRHGYAAPSAEAKNGLCMMVAISTTRNAVAVGVAMGHAVVLDYCL